MKKFWTLLVTSLGITLLLSGCRNEFSESQNTIKEFHLYAADVKQQLAEGKTLYSWGYGLWDEKNNKPSAPATVPGPELRVREGDHVKIVFHNRQVEPHTIHFHGIDNSFEGDGIPGVSQEEVKEGETYTYEFEAKAPGTYFYHCHVEPDRHIEMGLYGAFIVEPKKKVQYDGEYVMMLGERDPRLSAAESTEAGQPAGTAAEHAVLHGEYDTLDRKPAYYTINGKVEPDIPPLLVKKNGTYLIRVINTGSDLHSIHVHGHHFKVIASDGRDLANPPLKDTIGIAPGERYDLVLTADNPGIWPIHCHMGPHGTHGMHMMMVYAGFENKMGHHGDSDIAGGKTRILAALARLEQDIASDNAEKVKETGKQIWDIWTEFEDGVKEKNKSLYHNIEQVLGPLYAGTKLESVDQEMLNRMIRELKQILDQLENHAAH